MQKRFYREAKAERHGEAWLILLDGKPARTPRGEPLSLPTEALAHAIAGEWNGQGERLEPAGMMLTALANCALDQVVAHRRHVTEHALGFGRSDLVCYRAEDAGLAARQKNVWDPLLDWVLKTHNVRLVSDAGITFIEQPADALLLMQEIVAGLDDFVLAAFDAAASLAGSFVVALALVERRLTADDAFAAAQLDEVYQAEKWGRDPEAETRRHHLLAELNAVEQFVSLLPQSP